MPRGSRVVLPNYPHHIIQRGHNRQAVFSTDKDYLNYLKYLKEWKEDLGCEVYAYCLMTNHVHLIIDPGRKVENLGLLMKRVAGRQTRYVNKIVGRTGTLWEGRYKSSPIQTDEYLLACCRYIELNPVRAEIVKNPEDYPWSSYRHKVGVETLEWIDTDPSYAGMGSTKHEREERYQEWVSTSIPQKEWEIIRQAVQRGQLTGSKQFVEGVAQTTGKWVAFRGQGRPKKVEK